MTQPDRSNPGDGLQTFQSLNKAAWIDFIMDDEKESKDFKQPEIKVISRRQDHFIQSAMAHTTETLP